MFKLTIDNKVYEYNDKVTLEDLAKSFNKEAICCKVNNRIRELGFYVNFDATVEFLGFNDFDAIRVYETSLRYIIIMAIEELHPNLSVTFEQCISRSMSCHIEGLEADQDFLNALKVKIDYIVSKNYKINRLKMTKEEAMELYTKKGYYDKVATFQYRDSNDVNAYECNGYVNYMFGYTVPSTGYLKKYKLMSYDNDFIISYPRAELNGEIPEFEDSPNVFNMIRDARHWAKMINGFTVAQMNSHITHDTISDFVNLCETKHNDMLADLGKRVLRDPDIQVICIAGPSSSGKTTFSHRLRIELMARGINTVKISLDDYYVNREKCPKNPDGSYDFESIEALDLELFNKQLLEITQGKEVETPIFDFKNAKRSEETNKVKIEKGTIVIIEGIHALNERMTSSILKRHKFKIYISPLSQINIDNHNPISATDIRLLRRIVRDYAYRKTEPSETLAMWPSVRSGEFKWIYPYQEEADYIFNSELTYELGVLKKYALPQLLKIGHDNEYYVQANRLYKFLKYINEIDERYVPANSILREFIGGSCFYEESND